MTLSSLQLAEHHVIKILDDGIRLGAMLLREIDTALVRLRYLAFRNKRRAAQWRASAALAGYTCCQGEFQLLFKRRVNDVRTVTLNFSTSAAQSSFKDDRSHGWEAA
jgi:hypothetical protein